MTVTLREITDENRGAVRNLAVGEDQQRFVATNDKSFRDALAEPETHPWMRAIYEDEEPIGFLMLADDLATTPEHPWRYFLWRLMIDARYQRRGNARAAIALLREYLRSRPGATELFTSYVPGDGSPEGFYRRLGFEPTGEMLEDELVLRLPLGDGP